MIIEKKKVRDIERCNFCNRGIVNAKRTKLIYPYDFVYELSSDAEYAQKIRICEDCLNELKKRT